MEKIFPQTKKNLYIKKIKILKQKGSIRKYLMLSNQNVKL